MTATPGEDGGSETGDGSPEDAPETEADPDARVGDPDASHASAADAETDDPDAETDDPDSGTDTGADDVGVDYAWVMQVTFVATILLGVPVVAGLSAFVQLPTWESRVGFAARIGAVIWILVALSVYAYARLERSGSTE